MHDVDSITTSTKTDNYAGSATWRHIRDVDGEEYRQAQVLGTFVLSIFQSLQMKTAHYRHY